MTTTKSFEIPDPRNVASTSIALLSGLTILGSTPVAVEQVIDRDEPRLTWLDASAYASRHIPNVTFNTRV
jgi:hypothetical protein